jgi:hypothetical protein
MPSGARDPLTARAPTVASVARIAVRNGLKPCLSTGMVLYCVNHSRWNWRRGRVSQLLGSNRPRVEPVQLTELDAFLLVEDVCVVIKSPHGLEPPRLAR